MKIKIITGFRENQYYVIDINEAHKAYYLFLHPEERGVFKNGVALIGKNIQGIEPAWNETMGWKPTHRLDGDDWEEIEEKGLRDKMRDLMYEAKQIGSQASQNLKILNEPLLELKDKLI